MTMIDSAEDYQDLADYQDSEDSEAGEGAEDFDDGEVDFGPEWSTEDDDLADVLRDVLHEDYADAGADELDDALESVLAELSPAESINFAKALRRITSGAGSVLSNPLVTRAVRAGLPVGTGALGAVLGGPTGASLASNLGSTVAKALPGRKLNTPRPVVSSPPPTIQPSVGMPTVPPVADPTVVDPAVAAGSAAAAQGLVAMDNPLVGQALASLAFGASGSPTVGSVPVAEVVKMLSSIFNQAAADADELGFHRSADVEADSLGYLDDELDAPGRSLYVTLMDLQNADLEAEGWL